MLCNCSIGDHICLLLLRTAVCGFILLYILCVNFICALSFIRKA
ncbi:hypothetical protein HMPREF1585_00989 [Gardnerella vaginalis JCP8481B]|nr:hypothetical protein HMPREF1585_00989 [Gardnerella vaginalis JCP8481B]